MSEIDFDKFKNLTFEDFRRMAKDPTLSKYEKSGFPDAYRKGKEESIFKDIVRKVGNLGKDGQLVIEIGPGCSDLPHMLIDLCREKGHRLFFVDSEDILENLPDEPYITKIPGYYPRDCDWLFDKYLGKFNVVLAYSVLQHVFVESNPFDFVDRSLSLLAHDGAMLIGDIPNMSKRKRFFSSPNGIRFHQEFTDTNEVPQVDFNKLDVNKIDDGVLMGIIARCRDSGFDAFWLPQPESLPMANRREDLLITRP
ncbi:MAG: SAM-dependent methyltransferase [Anaerolineales bacterium]